MARLRVGVVGVGHLGKEHARILAGLPEVELVGVADVNAEQAETVARRWGTRAHSSYAPLLSQVDAATIVVPTCQHFEVAGAFLRRGIPLLVEKPLAADLQQADALVDLAVRHGALLQVGHIERFNPAFEELVRRPLRPKFIECERIGPFTGRSTDVGVVLDLMIHDLDLLLALVQAPVRSVEALGVCLFSEHEDAAQVRLAFENGCIANLTASRASPAPVRRMRLWGPEGYAAIDFARRRLSLVQPSEELRRHGHSLAPALLKDHLFGRYLEVLDLDCQRQSDQLSVELRHFVHCVQTGTRARVSGEDGRDAIALATRILERIAEHPWDGVAGGPRGPANLPEPIGRLFEPGRDQEAAA
jgi:predicted dehydrogenase